MTKRHTPTGGWADPQAIVEAEFTAGATRVEDLPAPLGVEIAFAGRSNVGKSSLMNVLMRRRHLVRTSSTPGCTRQISFFKTRTGDGLVATLADLPGYGYAKRSHAERRAWAGMIEGYLLRRPTLSLVVVLCDVRRGIEESERDLLALLAEPPEVARLPVQVIVALTKCDKVSVHARELAVHDAKTRSHLPVAPVSTLIPDTVVLLWREIRRTLEL